MEKGQRGTWRYLVQVDRPDLEPEDDDPKQTQDQCAISIYNVLWTDQIHPNLSEDTDLISTRFSVRM